MSASAASHTVSVDDADDSDYGSAFDDDDLVAVNKLLVRAPEKGLVRIPVSRRVFSHAEAVSMADASVPVASFDDFGLDPQQLADLAMLNDESGDQSRNAVAHDESGIRSRVTPC